jgi:hypothetical protein
MAWDGHDLLGLPSRIPHRNWKIIFVLGADEYIERLEGKIIECLFFYAKILYNNSVGKTFQLHKLLKQTFCESHVFPESFYLHSSKVG